MFSIGKMSKLTGIKIPTIRYYEQIGLIKTPERSHGNQRRYTKFELERLSFIKHARELGFSIKSIHKLVDLSALGSHKCNKIDQIAAEQLQSVKEKIKQLNSLKVELERIVGGCKTNKVKDCYVIQSLSDHSLCKNEHCL